MRTVSSTDADRLILVGSPVNAFFFGPRFSASVHRAFGLEMKDSHACCQGPRIVAVTAMVPYKIKGASAGFMRAVALFVDA